MSSHFALSAVQQRYASSQESRLHTIFTLTGWGAANLNTRGGPWVWQCMISMLKKRNRQAWHQIFGNVVALSAIYMSNPGTAHTAQQTIQLPHDWNFAISVLST